MFALANTFSVYIKLSLIFFPLYLRKANEISISLSQPLTIWQNLTNKVHRRKKTFFKWSDFCVLPLSARSPFCFFLYPFPGIFFFFPLPHNSRKIFCSLSGQQEAKLKTNNFWISTARQSECWLRSEKKERKKRVGGKTLRKEKASWGIWRAAALEGQGCLVWCGRSEQNLLGCSLGHLINRVIKAPSGPANHNIISDITTQIQGSRGSL